MPRINASDLKHEPQRSHAWVWVVVLLAVCGLGYGLYHREQAKAARAKATEVSPKEVQRLKEQIEAQMNERRQRDREFYASIGLTTAQMDELETINQTVTGNEARDERVKALLTADQFTKWQERFASRRGRRGDGNTTGPDGNRQGRRNRNNPGGGPPAGGPPPVP
jgi:hypothetical protein